MLDDVKDSLADLLGGDYMEAVCRCAVKLGGMDEAETLQLARQPVSFYSEDVQVRQDELLTQVGKPFLPAFANDNTGATTLAYAKATNRNAAPLGGRGIFRLGEDGKLYLAAKSEHYHAPLGHSFNGYKLIDRARQLGIPNATHNNTRGYITRLMERELIRCVSSLPKGDDASLDDVLRSTEPKVLNRVINLETGSLAVEAGIKMMLCRFYRLDRTYPEPVNCGKIPVFLVISDNNGGTEANYHGTTILAQTLRGMWPEFAETCCRSGLYKIVGVNINDVNDFKQKIAQYNQDGFKTAGFLHEIVLMNYGGILLDEDYLQQAYELCQEYDTPTLVDEIQSCMWYKGMLLYKLYGLKPDFAILGKGFPGGEYPASKIITTYEMDTLNQFGALVTNGQEELASLAYLITMAYAEANANEIQRMGSRFEADLRIFAGRHPAIIDRIEGRGHLAAIHFHLMEDASHFASILNAWCIDVSAQIYKADCPPAVLLKLPWIISEHAMAFVLDKMEQAIAQMAAETPQRGEGEA